MKITFSWLGAVNTLLYIFILAPLAVVIIASFHPGEFLIFPPEGFSWRWYEYVLTSGRYTKPFWNSIWIAIATTCISLPVGTIIAYALSRYEFRFKGVIQSLFLSPLVVPTLLFGIGLLMFFSSMGIKMYFLRLVLAHIVLTIPYVVRTMIASFSNLKRSIEEASVILGASPVKTFWLVTLPQVKSALIASAFISIVMSFDELVVALFLTGPGMNTLPMMIYSDIQFNLSPSLAAISSLIIVVTLAVGFLLAVFMQRKKRI
ncbi:ABC transporter permease [Paenibacillus beijingensis]|uniref:ABC transmembrane type-1 domain-containing protein n=1 Tax=Paenibacillus beijingensis TaxID=1126833 RepID=A0A0D5NK91_9BACL|nr:ABC transporter permease [Paenibacillus beijingensis]AJY75348.1 hypothetical protein VN24_13165 [Paenibacillus beijingensis]